VHVLNFYRKARYLYFLMVQERNQRLLSHDDKRLRIVDALRYQQGENEIVFTWPSSLCGQSIEVEFTRFSCIRVDVGRVGFDIAQCFRNFDSTRDSKRYPERRSAFVISARVILPLC
jgi:hypothetical protein